MLICHHANVDAQDEYNQTALFLAAREGSYQVAKILLQHGKANADLPDHMERFPRDIALERQHRDISQLIDEFCHGPGTGALSTLTLSQASGSSVLSAHIQASAGKSRSKKSSTSQRKQPAVRPNTDEDGLLRNSLHTVEVNPGHRLDVVPARPKKTKRQRVPAGSQSVLQSQLQTAAKLSSVLGPSEARLFAPEQPPSYENAINGRRARFAAMQRQAATAAASMDTADSHSVYHTGVAFEELQQFGASQDVLYAGMMPAEMVSFHPQQPTGVVLQPRSYISGGLGEADLTHMTHNSPTVPICHAYSPPNVATLQGPEATVVSSGHRSQPLSPVRQQLLQQQRMQFQNPYHQYHQSHLHPLQPMTSDNFDTSTAAYITAASAVPDITTYNHPTPSSATANTQFMFQYPTPPSHQNTAETTSPSLIQQTTNNTLIGYPTPSPDASPGRWSSSSPNSAKSDWSENARNGSPKRAVATNVTNEIIKNEPAFL